MIGVDTNVLLRYLAQDDTTQSPIVNRLFARLTKAEPGYISLVVLAEAVWVMRRSLRVPNDEVADAIERLLQLEELVVQNADEVHHAMLAMREETSSFADALIAELGAWAGCRFTYTFDSKASRQSAFRRLE
jgi:predicted nucleic-acid-binding protein